MDADKALTPGRALTVELRNSGKSASELQRRRITRRLKRAASIEGEQEVDPLNEDDEPEEDYFSLTDSTFVQYLKYYGPRARAIALLRREAILHGYHQSLKYLEELGKKRALSAERLEKCRQVLRGVALFEIFMDNITLKSGAPSGR